MYRGDYILFKLDPAMGEPVLAIPDLGIEKKLARNGAEAPYFKMKKTGTHAFTLGAVRGAIHVIEYRVPNYTEVSAAEARQLIENVQPLLLDVRTRPEFNRGHIPNSRLIPVQELQARWKELQEHQSQDILIYCATGNRSTVASKILIDLGFKRIYNLRRGIVDWDKRKN